MKIINIKKMKKQNTKKEKVLLLIILTFFFNLGLVFAVASFQVTTFSCSPSESVINDAFSCTAQIKNVGDSSGSVITATLYPDENDWLENSNYPQSSGTSVNPDQSTSITFSGLRAIKSGNNGFSKIMLDSVTDTYVADNNKKVNVINAAVTVNNSVSSAAMSEEITMTSEVTAGGNIDVSLTFAVSSGGCSIGSQTNPKTINGMTDGSKQSRTWTITQGTTTGNCQYTMSAAATGTGGVASKIDSTSSTITCTNCPVPSSTSSGGSSSGGSGGGGGGGAEINVELTMTPLTKILYSNGGISFNFSGTKHKLNVVNVSNDEVKITIESKKQNFTIKVGNEIKVDLNEDNRQDILIKLDSVNIITKGATLSIVRLYASETEESSGSITGSVVEKPSNENTINKEIKLNPKIWIYLIVGIVIILVVILVIYIIRKRRNPYSLRR